MSLKVALVLVLSLGSSPAVFAQPTSGAPGTGEGTEPVAIAGLLGGNVLVPLAQYVDGRWVRTWPLPDHDVEERIQSIADVPRGWYPAPGGVPRDWRLRAEGMNVEEALTTGAPVLGQAHCQAVWGLSLSGKAQAGHETTAIAVGGTAFVRSFGVSAPDSATLPFLARQAAQLESAAIDRSPAEPERTYDVRCANLETSGALCAFESVRNLTEPADPGLESERVVTVQGWFLKSRGSNRYLGGNATLTDGDVKELRSVIPFVVIGSDARTFVVVKEHGYEDESFKVLEVRGSDLKELLEIEGGGC